MRVPPAPPAVAAPPVLVTPPVLVAPPVLGVSGALGALDPEQAKRTSGAKHSTRGERMSHHCIDWHRLRAVAALPFSGVV
jgi:hypothetical protein